MITALTWAAWLGWGARPFVFVINLTTHAIVLSHRRTKLRDVPKVTQLKGVHYEYVSNSILLEGLWMSWDILKGSLEKGRQGQGG